MEVDQTFSYSPLRVAEREIRLLLLLPCEDADAIIEGKIVSAKLNKNPKYEALSYTWGEGNHTKTILLNGKVHHIRDNLWLALRRLRPMTISRILWIDAICINPEGTIERNHQVGLMAFIYKQAERVVVWLGVETDESRIAMRFLKKLTHEHVAPHYQYYGGYGYAKEWDALIILCMLG